MEGTYVVSVSVTDTQSGTVVFQETFNARRSEVYADGESTPGIDSVVDFLQKERENL